MQGTPGSERRRHPCAQKTGLHRSARTASRAWHLWGAQRHTMRACCSPPRTGKRAVTGGRAPNLTHGLVGAPGGVQRERSVRRRKEEIGLSLEHTLHLAHGLIGAPSGVQRERHRIQCPGRWAVFRRARTASRAWPRRCARRRTARAPSHPVPREMGCF